MLMALGGALAGCDAVLGIGDYHDRVADLGLDGGPAGPDLVGPDGSSGTEGGGPTGVDGGTDGSSEAGSIDFGAEPTGGPTLSTASCPDLSMAAAAATVYVDAKALGTEAGTKTAPFRTVAKAFASAAPNGVVWVAAGTYKENLVIPDKALLVLGGFAPGFGARTNACATILEAANVSQPVLAADDTVKRFAMEGLSVRKGARGIAVAGGGLGTASFTIARCVFSENGQTSQVGGAAALGDVNARIFGSVFRDNRASKGAAVASGGNVTLKVDQNLFDRNIGYADHGGALYLSPKSATITRNTFRANATGAGSPDDRGWGGAVIVYKDGAQAKADFAFNVFTENLAGIGGAVFVDDGATATMSHDLLYRNRSYAENGFLRGAAIYVDGTGDGPAGASTLSAEYLTVVNNRYDANGNLGAPASSFGGNVYVEGFSKATFKHSIFANNGDNAFYVEAQSEITTSYTIGPSQCTSSDAMGFIPANASICKIGVGVFQPATINFVDEAAENYHEKSTAGHYANGAWVIDGVTSAAIDKADPAATVGDEPAPHGGRANLGAFGRTKEASKSP
jgi:hypothetical protein